MATDDPSDVVRFLSSAYLIGVARASSKDSTSVPPPLHTPPIVWGATALHNLLLGHLCDSRNVLLCCRRGSRWSWASRTLLICGIWAGRLPAHSPSWTSHSITCSQRRWGLAVRMFTHCPVLNPAKRAVPNGAEMFCVICFLHCRADAASPKSSGGAKGANITSMLVCAGQAWRRP